jgi:hypothetical protein
MPTQAQSPSGSSLRSRAGIPFSHNRSEDWADVDGTAITRPQQDGKAAALGFMRQHGEMGLASMWRMSPSTAADDAKRKGATK